MKYRKKPVIVEAVQWSKKKHSEVCKFVFDNILDSNDASTSTPDEEDGLHLKDEKTGRWYKLKEGDWVVRNGQSFFPCKKENFEKNYEPT